MENEIYINGTKLTVVAVVILAVIYFSFGIVDIKWEDPVSRIYACETKK